MLGRGLFVLTLLYNCVLSLPLTTPSQLENEDVKVVKCIVEALADVLSRPHPVPVSQECLDTLRTDDRLVSIIYHHNFLKELQEIAVEGSKERAQLQRDAGSPDSITQTPHTAADVADRSMLEALGGPGERSILSQKRRTEHRGREEEKDEHELKHEESHEGRDVAEEAQVKRENDEKPGSHISESADKEAEKREEEEHDVGRGDAGENSQENVAKDKKKGGRSGDKEDGRRNKPKVKTFGEEDKKQEEKRSAFFSHKHKAKAEEQQDEGETEEESWGSVKRWAKRDKALKRKMVEEEAEHHHIQQEEVPHHSKEISNEEEEELKKKRGMQRSPEEKELQMIARRPPEERQGAEEEGSASRKPEEPEIESLATIESELENVAQKLHELRRG